MRKTKRSLILSVLSLMLCIAMLLGTTYAWFTDSVTSGKNKIVAGNLDIELEYTTDGTTWIPVTEETKLFDDEALWEPGHTEVAYLRLSNKGTLALKYSLAVNINNEVAGTNVAGQSFKLSDYIKMGVVETWNGTVYANRDAARAAVTNAGNIVTYSQVGKMEASATAKLMSIVVFMPEEVGNEANYKTGTTAPSIEMGVNVVATQYTSESDSFDKYYDVKTEPITVYTADEFTKAVEQSEGGETINVMTAGLDLTVAYTDAKTLTIKGEKINKLTANIPNGTIHVYNEVTEVVGTNVDLENSAHFYNKIGTLTANAGHFVVEEAATVENIVAAPAETEELVIEIKGTVEKVDVPKADTNIAVVVDEGATLTTLNITDEGPNAKIVLQNEGTVGNETAVATKTQAIAGIDEESKVLTIKTVNELKAFAKNVNGGNSYKEWTVELANDIDLKDIEWKSISGFAGTFDGKNHKISNMTLVDNTSNYVAFFATFGGTVKNVTFEKASVTGNRAAIVIEWTTGGPVVVDNVKVLNSVVDGEQKNGGIIGFASGKQNGGCTDVTVKNCTVDGLTFKNDETKERAWQSGAIIGYLYPEQNVTVTGNTVKNVTIENDPAINYPTTPLYASHPLIGVLDVKNSSAYTISISNNTIENCAGFATGNSTTAYCGGFNATPNGAKVLIDGGEVITISATGTQEQKQTAITSAITSAKTGVTTKIALPAGTFNIANGVSGSKLVIVGQTDSTGKILTSIDNANADTYKTLAAEEATFENITFIGRAKEDANPDGSKACGYAHNGSITYKNCTFIGSCSFFNYGTVQNIIDCTFTTTDTDAYALWTYGDGTFNITGCKFYAEGNSKGKAIKVFTNNHNQIINVTDCEFYNNSTKDSTNKPAIAIGQGANSSVNLTVSGCTLGGTKGFSCKDDAMETWYNNYMSTASVIDKQTVGAETAAVGATLDDVHVTVNGNSYNPAK